MADETAMGKLRLRPGDIELRSDQLERTPLFAKLPEAAARRLRSARGRGAVVARRYQAGEVIVRQGDPGWTAFYMLRAADVRRLQLNANGSKAGSVDPNTEASVKMKELILEKAFDLPVKAEVRVASGVSARVKKTSLLHQIGDLAVRRIKKRSIFTTDTEGVLTPNADGTAVGYIREGELFGEGSCFSHAPRSATIVATEDCFVLELVRNVLEIALENIEFRQALDWIYRQRVLESHIQSMPLFAGAPPEALDQLRRRAKLVTYTPGDIVYEEGTPADSVYFVRRGTLKLFSKDDPTRVLAYVSRGESVGLGAVLENRTSQTTCVAHGPTEASVGTRVELVRIRKVVFDEVMETFPVLGVEARRIAAEQYEQVVKGTHAVAVENFATSLGLVQAERVMLIDLDRCTRCDDCVQACADTHGGVARLTRTGARFGRFLIPDTCRQCVDPTCLIGCPVGSIHRGSSGEIVVEDWCIGCGLCAEQCPYDAIGIVKEGESRQAMVCDQCQSVGDGTPMCVYACGAEAAHRVDGQTFFK